MTEPPDVSALLAAHGIEIPREEIKVLNAVAQIYAERGDPESARTIYRGVLLVEPDNNDALCGMAALHRTAGELHQAAELYRRALGRQPNQLYPTLELGRILVELGETFDAVRVLKCALDYTAGTELEAEVHALLQRLDERD